MCHRHSEALDFRRLQALQEHAHVAGGCAGTVAHLTACTSQAFIFLFIFPISAADAGDIKLPPTTYLFQDAFKTVHVNHCGVGSFFLRNDRPGARVQCLLYHLIAVKSQEVDWPAAACG